MTNKFLKYLGIAVILSFGSLFSKTAIDLSKLNSGISSQKVSNLNVLAIMVEFEEDTLDFTTGNGTFNSGYEYPDSLLLDAVDHNVEYFTDQLTYVKNYFQSVSDGNVVFDNITVLDTIITLNHPIWYYNQNHTDELLEEKLYELYQSSWNKIASDTSIDFTIYDTFVIFHAGSGQEFSAGYDDTPFDIPSVFFSENDLSSTSVTAHDGTEINNCIILPESEWQISNDKWLYAGMGGISTLMFAHRLGIPNLYSSEDGQSCIGKFGLMDQGSGNFSGMMPSSVCAWVKEQQGWADIQDITSSQDSIVAAADSTIYRIPINNDEYFLIENRTPTNYTLANSEIYGYDRDSLRIKFYYGEYGVERYEIVDAGFKTLVSIQDNDYDFALTYGFETEDPYDPQTLRTGGILIWHIDKRKTTAENIVNNTVNDDYDNRGVYLEEGDGSFDIGKDYWLFDAGYGTELGWYYDFFSKGNEAWIKYSNKDLGDVEFSGASYPRSDSNEGVDTGIRLFDFSGINRRMRFSFEMENQLTGYPIDSGLEDGRYYPFYISNQLHHLFYRNNGEFKVMTEDSLVYSDNTGITFSDKFEPISYGGSLRIVSSDSLIISSISVYDQLIDNIPTPKVTGQIKHDAIPTIEGLRFGIGSPSYIFDSNEICDVAITLNSFGLNYIAAIKEDSLFIRDGFGNPTSTFHDAIEANSKVILSGRTYDDINDIYIINSNSLLKFSIDGTEATYINEIDKENMSLLNDLDEDGNIDYLVTDQGTIEVYNEHGFMENGFPLDTRVDQIDNIFTYETDDGKFCTFVDSAMNCGSFSYDGDYVRTDNFTLGSDINDIGLFESNGQVCIYSYDNLGTLNAFPLHLGDLDSYRKQQNGFIQLAAEDVSTSSSITDKKSVYNWPNPAKGNSTNFRFFLNEPSTVNITIYDLNGNRVKELSETFTASGDNFEIEWDVSSKPSGLYTAVLEFVSGSKNEKYKVKVAIIK
jgi:M6 family metalloprotease-like protein